MSRTIDEKVVEMKFDNSNFEANVKTSMSTLDKLRNSLKLTESAASLKNFDQAANKINFGGFNKGIDEVKARISSLDMVANTVLSRLTNSVIDFGKKIITAIPNQIKQGGIMRAENIEQAKFQLKGLGYAWSDVEDSINHAVKGTAYGMDAAAKVASQLLASNVKLGDDMSKSLRSVSGLAAMTGSSYEEIGHIMTSIAGQGRVMTNDLMQFSTRGINVAAALGEQLGKSEAEIRAMVSKGKIDFQTFANAMDDAFGSHATAANETFSGALSNMKAALSRIGEDFATPGRESLREFFVTMQGVFDNIRASIKPISKFFAIISKSFFNGINDRLATFNTYFKDLGGSKKIAEGLANILMAIWERLKAVGEAFSEVFPPATTDGLNSALDRFVEFTKTLRANEEQLKGVKAVATGVFNAFKIVGQVLGVVLKILGAIGPKLIPIITIVATVALLGKGISFLGNKIKWLASGLLYIIPLLKTLGIVGGIALAAFAGYNIVKAIVNNWDTIVAAFKKAGDTIKGFFTDLNNKYPIFGQMANGLKMLFGAIGGLISNGLIALGKVDWQGVGNKIKSFFSAVKDNGYKNLIAVKDALVKFGEGVKTAFNNLKSVLQDKGIFGALSNFGDKASEKIDKVKDLFGMGKKSSKGIKKGGIVDSVTGGEAAMTQGTNLLTKFGDALKWVRENITIGKVAAVSFSIGILKLLGSISKALDTTVDIGKSFAGIGTALSGTITNAGNVFKLFSDKGNITEFIKTWKGTSKVKPILQVAIAIGILAASLAVLAAIPTENLIKGGIALGAIVVVLGILTKVMSKIQMPTLVQLSGNILMLGIAIGIIAAALTALTSAKSGDDYVGTIIKLVGAIAAMGVFMYMLNKFGQIAKISLRSSIYVVAMAIAIYTIIKSLLFLNDLQTDQLLEKMIFVLAVIALLIPLTKVMQGVKFGSAVGILAIAIALRILLPTLMDALTQVDPEKLINLIEQHALTFIALTLAILVILEQLKRAQNGMLAVGAMMILLAASVGVAVLALNGIIKIVESAKPEAIVAALIIFAALLAAFVVAMIVISKKASQISKISLSLGAMFIAIGVSINLMAMGMDKLGSMSKAKIEKAGGAVAAIVALFALMLLVTQIRGGGPKAAARVALMFMSIGVAVIAIAGAMSIIGGIPNDQHQFDNALGAISGILLLFAALVGMAAFSKEGLRATTGVAMLAAAIGAAMLAISVAMKIISTIPAEDMVGPLIAIGGMFVGFFFLLKQAQQIKSSSLKAILGIVVGIVAIGVELMILSLFEWYEILPAALAITAALIGFSMVLKYIGNMSKFKDKDKLKSLGLMALMLAEIGGILIGLSILPWYQVAAAGAALTAVMLAFAKLAKTISGSTGIKMDKMKGLLVMSLALIPIGAALALVATQNWANILAAGAAIVGTLLALTLMAKVISGTQGLKASKMGPLLLMCLTLVPIGAALALVATQNWTNILAAGAAIVGVLLSLTLMAKVVSGSKGLKANKMGPLLLMTLALVPISLALTVVASQPWQGILAAMAGISGTLLALAAALAIVSATKVNVGNAAAFALASLAIIPIGAALALLSMFPWESMLAAMLSASVVMIALSVALAIIAATKVNVGNAAAFLVASLGVVAIGAALAMVATQPWPQILAAMGAVVGVMITLGIILGLLAALPATDLMITSAAVLVACIGIAAIGVALSQLAAQPWQSILASMGAVIGVMVALGILLGLLSIIAIGTGGIGAIAIIAVAGAIALLGLAVQMAGQGLLSGAMGINMFIGSLMLMQAIDMNSLAPNIGQLALALIEIGGAGMVLALGATGLILGSAGIMMLGMALPLLASIDFNSMHGGMLQFAVGLGAIGLAALTLIPSAMFINTFAMGIAMMAPALVLLNTCQNLATVGLGLSSIASALLQMIPTAMIIMPLAMGMMALAQALVQMSMASMQASMTLTMAITSFQLALTTMQMTLQTQTMQKYFEIGSWIPKSIAKGILAEAPGVIGVAARVASGIEEAIRDTLGIHSESEDLNEVGQWVDKSIANGGTEASGELFDVFNGIGSQIPEELSSGILGNLGSAESAGSSLGSGVGSAIEGAVSPFLDSVKLKIANIAKSVGQFLGNPALTQLGETYEKALTKVNKANDQLADGSRRFEQNTKTNKTATSELEEELKKLFNVEEDVTDASNNGADAADGYADSLNGLGGAAGGASEAMGGLADTIANQMDLFEEFNMNTELTGEQLLNNMRSQIQGVSQWAANMQELALRGMAPGLYKKLMDLGPQGYEKVNAFMQMNAAQLAEANQLYATSLTLPGFAAKQVEGAYNLTGQDAGQGFLNGLNSMNLYAGGVGAAQNTLDGMTSAEGLFTGSPSKKTFQVGEWAVQGLNNGMKAQLPFVDSTSKTIAQRIIENFKTFFSDPVNSMSLGQSIMQGFLTGMNTLAAEGGLNAQTLANTLLTVFSYDLGYNGLIEFVQGMIDYLTESFLLEDGTSGYMYDLAQALVDGLKLWFEENGEDFLEFVDEEWLTPLKDKIDEYIGEDAAKDMGKCLVDGLKAGIEENSETAIGAARTLGEECAAAFKAANKIDSPSKVFYGFGKFLDMGLANGIRAYTNLPVDAVYRMGDTINAVASRVSAAIDDNMDMSPVIRPVIDTTNVASGISMMNSMFGSAQARVSATATGYAEAMRLKAAQLELSKNAQNKLNASYASALVDAVNSIGNTDTNVNVVLAGDAAGVFKLVRTENTKFVKSTGYAPLAQGR